MDGRYTVQDIVDRCLLGEFDTYRILYDLLDRNLIEEVRVESPSAPTPPTADAPASASRS